jgi:CMP-N,N'-diacetyllegionaminic acid synthase
MILGIIPARGGSKRLPGKNLRSLGGKPMIQHTIEAAQQSVALNHFVVCTEDRKISEFAASAGVEIFRRLPEMAQDHSLVYETIDYVLDGFPTAEWVVLLQPTSPLRTAADIDAAINLCISTTSPSCVSCEHGVPVPNGAVYVAYASWLREHGNFDGPRTITYGMPAYRSVDVDTLADFERAQALMEDRDGPH